MKRNTVLTLFFAVLIVLNTGCAAAGVASHTYTEPGVLEVENELLVPIPFEQAWDKMVRELAVYFYVINNIDKESRLINVSFSSNSPEQFVTGGTTTRIFRRQNKVENVSYDAAASSTYKIGWTWGPLNNLPVTGTYDRRTSLEGRANIYMAPEGSGAIVTVNCHYILTVNVTGTYVAENAFGGISERGVTPSSLWTATFNTNAPAKVNWGTTEEPFWLTFRSTGKFENDILSILR